MDRLSERSRTPRLASFNKDAKTGRIVNLICDGWETKNKKHINGVIFLSGSQWVTYCNENGNIYQNNEHHGAIAVNEI